MEDLVTGGWKTVVMAYLGISVGLSFLMGFAGGKDEQGKDDAKRFNVKAAVFFPFELFFFILLILPYHIVWLFIVLPGLYLLGFLWKAFVYVLFNRMRAVFAFLIALGGFFANWIFVIKAIQEVFSGLSVVYRVGGALALTGLEIIIGLVFWDVWFKVITEPGETTKKRREALFTTVVVTVFFLFLLGIDYKFQTDMVRIMQEVGEELGMSSGAGVTGLFPMLSVLTPLICSLVAFLFGRKKDAASFECDALDNFGVEWAKAKDAFVHQLGEIRRNARQFLRLALFWPYYFAKGIVGEDDARPAPPPSQ